MLSAASVIIDAMIVDGETNTVFISDLLPSKFPRIVDALQTNLVDSLRTIPRTKDIWCRDYMPVQVGKGQLVQFQYRPDYLMGLPRQRTEDAASLLTLTDNAYRSSLVVDGGNIVHHVNTAILTEKVYGENPKHDPVKLRAEISRLLGVERVITIPTETDDPIGHADGMMRFVNEDTVLVNDYSEIFPALQKDLADCFTLHGLKAILFPYFPTTDVGPDPDIPPAAGCYINFLRIRGIVFCPAFGRAEDEQAMKVLSECFPSQRIVPVPCGDLAMEGGVLNCVTWNIRTGAE